MKSKSHLEYNSKAQEIYRYFSDMKNVGFGFSRIDELGYPIMSVEDAIKYLREL